jgi:hypothetical protein
MVAVRLEERMLLRLHCQLLMQRQTADAELGEAG